MQSADEGSTSPTLLREVRNWHDALAWSRFKTQYDPLLLACCRTLRLGSDAIDEVSQQTWIEVARRMQLFVYDGSHCFRGWLWTVCRNKGLEYLRKTKNDLVLSFDDLDKTIEGHELLRVNADILDTEQCDNDDERLSVWILRAATVQAAVRAKVQPQTWDAFWLIAVRSWTVPEETVLVLAGDQYRRPIGSDQAKSELLGEASGMEAADSSVLESNLGK